MNTWIEWIRWRLEWAPQGLRALLGSLATDPDRLSAAFAGGPRALLGPVTLDELSEEEARAVQDLAALGRCRSALSARADRSPRPAPIGWWSGLSPEEHLLACESWERFLYPEVWEGVIGPG